MTEFLSAAFVITFLVLLGIIAGIGFLLNLFAGKSWPAVGWLVGMFVCFGLLFFTLGGN